LSSHCPDGCSMFRARIDKLSDFANRRALLDDLLRKRDAETLLQFKLDIDGLQGISAQRFYVVIGTCSAPPSAHRWGEPSAPLRIGEIAGLPIVFLSRHDKGHCPLIARCIMLFRTPRFGLVDPIPSP
jgi:hypothetical protein